MKVDECLSYTANLDDYQVLRGNDGKSAFKIYFCSITGRPTPERYQWNLTALTKEKFIADFQAQRLEGIGFVTAFPHIVKIFRYAPNSEVLQYVRAYRPADGTPVNLARPEDFTEFACYAEAMIAADEFRFWAEAPTVEAYFAKRCEQISFPVLNHGKLKTYWEQ